MNIQGFDYNKLRKDAQMRWLRPAEILYILQNHEKYRISPDPPQKPRSGSLYLFNRRVLRYFRKDGHNWRKKKDGKNVGEAHERLKVGNVDALNCYYAHGEQNPYFQRRSYWMLDPAYEHIVLVHYLEVSENTTERARKRSFTSTNNEIDTSLKRAQRALSKRAQTSCSPHEAYPNIRPKELKRKVDNAFSRIAIGEGTSEGNQLNPIEDSSGGSSHDTDIRGNLSEDSDRDGAENSSRNTQNVSNHEMLHDANMNDDFQDEVVIVNGSVGNQDAIMNNGVEDEVIIVNGIGGNQDNATIVNIENLGTTFTTSDTALISDYKKLKSKTLCFMHSESEVVNLPAMYILKDETSISQMEKEGKLVLVPYANPAASSSFSEEKVNGLYQTQIPIAEISDDECSNEESSSLPFLKCMVLSFIKEYNDQARVLFDVDINQFINLTKSGIKICQSLGNPVSRLEKAFKKLVQVAEERQSLQNARLVAPIPCLEKAQTREQLDYLSSEVQTLVSQQIKGYNMNMSYQKRLIETVSDWENEVKALETKIGQARAKLIEIDHANSELKMSLDDGENLLQKIRQNIKASESCHLSNPQSVMEKDKKCKSTYEGLMKFVMSWK